MLFDQNPLVLDHFVSSFHSKQLEGAFSIGVSF